MQALPQPHHGRSALWLLFQVWPQTLPGQPEQTHSDGQEAAAHAAASLPRAFPLSATLFLSSQLPRGNNFAVLGVWESQKTILNPQK